MEFVCKYAKPSGEIISSVQVGHSVEEVQHRLQEQGLLPLSVRPRAWSISFRPVKKVTAIKADDFIIFNQQFVALIKAGLPILRSLDLLKARIKNPLLRRHIEDVRDRVLSGALLSDALEAQGVFPRVYTASVFAGERTGNLVEVIGRYIQYEKTILAVRKRFRNSLIYPAFLVVLSMVMVGVVVTYVIPRFAELYTGLNATLPLPTAVLIGVSTAIQQNLMLLVPVLLGGLVFLRIWLGSVRGQNWMDELKLKLPILGNIWTMFAIAQLSRTLATLLQGGIPLVTALEAARGASGNRVIGRVLADASDEIRQGKSLSDSLERGGHFPELALEMVRVGEQTGSLPEMLNHVADFYDEDVNTRMTALLSWVEPVILIFIALFVAAILISLYLPIFSIGARAIG